jgi:hypothetical protein
LTAAIVFSFFTEIKIVDFLQAFEKNASTKKETVPTKVSSFFDLHFTAKTQRRKVNAMLPLRLSLRLGASAVKNFSILTHGRLP